MMSSMHGASVWDWLSAALMMVGFVILMGLAIYLMVALASGNDNRAPGNNRDRLVPGRTDEDLGSGMRPLAS